MCGIAVHTYNMHEVAASVTIFVGLVLLYRPLLRGTTRNFSQASWLLWLVQVSCRQAAADSVCQAPGFKRLFDTMAYVHMECYVCHSPGTWLVQVSCKQPAADALHVKPQGLSLESFGLSV
jgi:hypothetical protein